MAQLWEPQGATWPAVNTWRGPTSAPDPDQLQFGVGQLV